MKYAAEKLNIGNDMEKWYNVLPKKLEELGGSTLLQHYRHSISDLLMTVFPYVS